MSLSGTSFPSPGDDCQAIQDQVDCPQDAREMHVTTDLPLGLGFPPRAKQAPPVTLGQEQTVSTHPPGEEPVSLLSVTVAECLVFSLVM